MKYRIKDCGVDVNNQILAFKLYPYEFDKAKQLAEKDLSGYVIDIVKPKRSLSANNYMWKLADEISDRVGITRMEVYKQAIREAGVFTELAVKEKEFNRLCRAWGKRGDGWFIDEGHQQEDLIICRASVGSSSYNSKEMSRLIDYIVSEAQFYNIETETPEQIERLKALWGE